MSNHKTIRIVVPHQTIEQFVLGIRTYLSVVDDLLRGEELRAERVRFVDTTPGRLIIEDE